MGYFYFILLTFYLFSIQLVFGNYEVSPNEEEIKVLLPRSHDVETDGCLIQILNNDDSNYHTIVYYTKGFPIKREDGIQYIGQKDNTCSFILYPNHEVFKRDEAVALRKRWKIMGLYQCNFLGTLDSCNIGYDVFFNPQSFYERLLMDVSQTKIIRSAPYTNKTLTIRTSSETKKIFGCRLALHEVGGDSLWKRILRPKYAFDSVDIYTSSGIKFIGHQDNSCSFRVDLDFINELNERYNGFLDRYWTISAILSNKDGSQNVRNYKFYMNSLAWWKNDHTSNVFLTRRVPWLGGSDTIDVQYY